MKKLVLTLGLLLGSYQSFAISEISVKNCQAQGTTHHKVGDSQVSKIQEFSNEIRITYSDGSYIIYPKYTLCEIKIKPE
jgi:hypothetical protein